jgi:hypothetical protein
VGWCWFALAGPRLSPAAASRRGLRGLASVPGGRIGGSVVHQPPTPVPDPRPMRRHPRPRTRHRGHTRWPTLAPQRRRAGRLGGSGIRVTPVQSPSSWSRSRAHSPRCLAAPTRGRPRPPPVPGAAGNHGTNEGPSNTARTAPSIALTWGDRGDSNPDLQATTWSRCPGPTRDDPRSADFVSEAMCLHPRGADFADGFLRGCRCRAVARSRVIGQAIKAGPR